jgi:hypothetical protein
MNVNIAAVEKLKQKAKSDRDFDDLPAALSKLEKCIELLRHELTDSAELPEHEDAAFRSKIEKELADCYGMSGGIYRRAAMRASGHERDKQLESAQTMYELGAGFERDDSYNLTNTIVIPLLRDPGLIVPLQPEIARARDKVRQQVEGGPRGKQWWAWADLGLLSLLVGDLNGALHAYAQFRRLGAGAMDYQSTINVLEDLQNVGSGGAMTEWFAAAIAFLLSQKKSVS